MQTIINTRGLTVSRSYRDRLSQRLTKLAALWPGLVEAKVVLSKEKHRRTAGITVLAPHHTFRSEETAPDLAVAVDLAVEAVGRQVVALKERVKHRKGRPAARRVSTRAEAGPTDDLVVQQVSPKPMSVAEAVEQFKLGREPFLVFTNAQSDAVNVLYRRRGGGLGLIEPVA